MHRGLYSFFIVGLIGLAHAAPQNLPTPPPSPGLDDGKPLQGVENPPGPPSPTSFPGLDGGEPTTEPNALGPGGESLPTLKLLRPTAITPFHFIRLYLHTDMVFFRPRLSPVEWVTSVESVVRRGKEESFTL